MRSSAVHEPGAWCVILPAMASSVRCASRRAQCAEAISNPGWEALDHKEWSPAPVQ